jgi:hypothetical protein
MNVNGKQKLLSNLINILIVMAVGGAVTLLAIVVLLFFLDD